MTRTNQRPVNKRQHLRGMVAGKNRWSERQLTDGEKAIGFLGWHERGYLPHCDFPNLVQFVTFRLEDSMPAARQGEWEHLLKIEDLRERRMELEAYLDRGIGKCLLQDASIAGIAEEALLHFHEERYELLAWCVMPNHVHVLVDARMTPLSKLVQNWKVRTENQVRKLLALVGTKTQINLPGRCPALQFKWQREYWDTFMRDEKQTGKAIRYIENNPVKAGLCRTLEEWSFSSARFRDEYRRLIIPQGKTNE
jgi:putative transposase